MLSWLFVGTYQTALPPYQAEVPPGQIALFPNQTRVVPFLDPEFPGRIALPLDQNVPFPGQAALLFKFSPSTVRPDLRHVIETNESSENETKHGLNTTTPSVRFNKPSLYSEEPVDEKYISIKQFNSNNTSSRIDDKPSRENDYPYGRSVQVIREIFAQNILKQILNVMNWKGVPNTTSDDYVKSLKDAKLDSIYRSDMQADQPFTIQTSHLNAEVKHIFIQSTEPPNLAGEHFNGVVRSSLLYFNVHTPLRDEYDVSQALIKIRVIAALKDKRPIDLANYGIEQQLQVFIDMVVSEGDSVTFKTITKTINRDHLTGGQFHVDVFDLVDHWLKDPSVNNMGFRIKIRNVANLTSLDSSFCIHGHFGDKSDSAAVVNRRLPVLMLRTTLKNPHVSEHNNLVSANTKCPKTPDGQAVLSECCAQEEEFVFGDLGWNFVVFPESFTAQICMGPCVNSVQTRSLASELARIGSLGDNKVTCCSPQRRKSLELLIATDWNTARKILLHDVLPDGCVCR